MNVEGEWRWFTALRLAVARATVWMCCKLMVWSLRVCLAPDHPMRVFYDGWLEMEMPTRLEALRRPANPRARPPRPRAHWALMVAAPTLLPVAMLVPSLLIF